MMMRNALGVVLVPFVVGCAVVGCAGGRGGSPAAEPRRDHAIPTSDVPVETPAATTPTTPPAKPNLTVGEREPARRLADATDFIVDVALPANGDRNARNAGLAEFRRLTDQYRNLNPADLKATLGLNSPHASVVQAFLRSRSDNEVIRQLGRYLTDADPDRVGATATLLMEEIFNDKNQVGSKLGEMTFDLTELARRGLYDEAIASRVAYLQAQVDQALTRDHRGQIAKLTLFVVGSAVASGVLAGRQINLVDKASGLIRKVPVEEILNAGRLKSFASRSFHTLTSLERTAAALSKKFPNPLDLARAELKTIGFTETEVNRLGFAPATKAQIDYLAGESLPKHSVKLVWQKTDRDRVEFALSRHWNGELNGERVLLLRVRPPLGQPQILAGERRTEEAAEELAQRLAKKPNVEYLSEVTEGGVQQTTIRADKRPELNAAPTSGPKVERLGPTPETPAFAPRGPLPEVPVQKFDWVRAAVAATKTGALLTPPTVLGYAWGTNAGRDEENVYFERQVDRPTRPNGTDVTDLNQR